MNRVTQDKFKDVEAFRSKTLRCFTGIRDSLPKHDQRYKDAKSLEAYLHTLWANDPDLPLIEDEGLPQVSFIPSGSANVATRQQS